MQNSNEKNSNASFEWTYKVLCREKNVKPLPAVQTYLPKNYLRFCADHVNLKDWLPILSSIIQDRSLSKICVYSRCPRKRINEKLNAEKKFVQSRRCARNGRQQPVLYTNFLLRCFVHSVAACLRDSLMITNLALEGIPLTPKYLKILSDGLANNRNLRSLSLARCRIGDAGCDTLLDSLQHNLNLHILNLSSCCLTNRSVASFSLFFKTRKADLMQNMWKESLSKDACTTMEEGLRTLILDKNHKFSDTGLRQLTRILKHNFCLKTLCLRCCGISQNGGEIVLELLRTNSVLTHIDLRNNEVSIDVLHTIYKILKRRQSKGERMISMKKRLLSRKLPVTGQKIISKKVSAKYVSKNNELSKKNEIYAKKPRMQCVSQILQFARAWKMRRKNDRKSRDTTKNYVSLHQNYARSHQNYTRSHQNYIRSHQNYTRSHQNDINWTNVDELKENLMVMIEGNQRLITVLENSTDFLMKERDRRLCAEKAYQKLQPYLKNLKNKIVMQNSIQSNMHYENKVYTNLQNVFDELKTSINKKKFAKTRKNPEEDGNKKKDIVQHRKDQSYQSEIAHLSHRISDCIK